MRFLLLLSLLVPSVSFAHSGRLNSQGCHQETRRAAVHCHRVVGLYRVPRRTLRAMAEARNARMRRTRLAADHARPVQEWAPVLSVTDGDTIRVRKDGKSEPVRIVGIDAPEQHAQECFSTESTLFLRNALSGKTVVLHRGSEDNRDQYGRLLRYVHVDGVDIGAQMLQEGYVKHFPWFSHPRTDSYAEHEREAQEEGRGLWWRCKG